MTRKNATGQLVTRDGKRGTSWGIRVRTAGGDRVFETLGRSWGPDAITAAVAAERAEVVMAQVRLGQYRSPRERAAAREAATAGRVEVPSFADFAAGWLDRQRVTGGRRGDGLTKAGLDDLSWRLAHLNGWFGGMRLDEVDEAEVERYAAAKRGAAPGSGGLGATSVNKTLGTLESIMRTAIRYRLIERNPAMGYRVAGSKYVAAHLETAAQMSALLTAAGEMDRGRRGRRGHGQALLSTLLIGGLRIGEAIELRWSDVNLARGTMRVRGTKTEHAERRLELLPPLREALAELKARRGGGPGDRVFGTVSGGPESRGNLGRRLLGPAVEAANVALAGAGEDSISPDLTLHGLRHTCASVLLYLGEDAGHVADQLGHADPGFTYTRYRKRMRRIPGEAERIRVLMFGEPIDDAESPLGRGGTSGHRGGAVGSAS
jgi:integrase